MTMSGRKRKPFIPGAMWASQDQPEPPRLSWWARIKLWWKFRAVPFLHLFF